MFTVKIDDELLAKLREMLEDEDDGSVVRIREYKLGGGCRTRIILGLAIEDLDEDEDETIDVDGVTFAAEGDFLLRYGREFAVKVDDGRMVVDALAADQD